MAATRGAFAMFDALYDEGRFIGCLEERTVGFVPEAADQEEIAIAVANIEGGQFAGFV